MLHGNSNIKFKFTAFAELFAKIYWNLIIKNNNQSVGW